MNSSPYYDPLAQEDPVPPQAAPPTPPPPVVNAYNRDYGAAPRRPSRQTPVSQPVEPAPVREPEDTGSPRTTPPRRRKRRKWPWVLLILVLLLVVIPVGFWFLFPSRPDNTVGKVGDVATFLLAGTDADGTRTDTMMLLYVNRDTDTINLLSLPRDSHVTVDGHDMKLNAVYSYGGCGQEGMELLMEQMKDVLGYRPDCYALFSLESIVELIDTMGGITFDVPMDMYYEDSAQDLYIDLQAGTQTLNGEQAVQVLRYRSGYALADLERVNVQREMVNAAMEQWLTLGNGFNGLRAIWNLTSDAVTNISTRNFLWLAQSALSADLGAMQSETLPGEWESPYYWLYRYDRADMINSYFNPTGITFSGEDYTR